MSDVKAIVRGSTLFVFVTFTDQDKQPISPSSAKLRIAYAKNGVRQFAEADMVEHDDDEWSGSWDTTPADAGPIFSYAHANADPKAAVQGEVMVKANPANPQGS